MMPAPHADRDLWSHGRLAALCLLGGLWLLGAGLRLWVLQVEQHERYVGIAEEQQQLVVKLDEPRGTVYDARGRVLAVSVEARSVAADPKLVDDPESLAEALAAILPADRATLLEALRGERRFVWLERKVDPPIAARVERLIDAGHKGLMLLPESKRYYPLGTLAGSVLGYVGMDNHGLGGLEYRYEETIATRAGRRTLLRDGLAAQLLYPELPSAAAHPGEDLHLTLDSTVQHIMESELRAAVEQHGATRATAVMLDPHTGAVLAMASFPNFDPNRFDAVPAASRANLAVGHAFEPGSTFKMVTLAAALEANAVDPQELFDCGRGSIVLRRTRIRDHKPFDRLTAREIMMFSSNIGAIRLAARAGTERFHSTIRAFGFGRPTGIDLPSESAGIVRPLDSWSHHSPAYISFGQGIAVTTLQMASSFAAIANEGRLLRPYLVRAVGAPPAGGDDKTELLGLPIAPSSARQVRAMLESVVLEGTGKRAALDGWRAAGKTGTAQKAIEGGGGYQPNRYIASFVGFAPLDSPVLAMAVTIDEPWPAYHGGEAAAPVFSAIAEKTLLYLGVPPDRPRPDAVLLGSDAFDSIRLAAAGAPEAPARADGSARTAAPARVTTFALDLSERIAAADGTVPDFEGLTAREALQLASRLGIAAHFDGHGAVARQTPAAGTPLERTDRAVRLSLETTRPEVTS